MRAEVHEVYLCTDRTATDTVGIHSVTIPSAWIAHQYREGFFPVNEPFIPILELIIPCVQGFGESVAISNGTTVPEGVFAVRTTLSFLCQRRAQKKHTNGIGRTNAGISS